jgi:hypothetical protein
METISEQTSSCANPMLARYLRIKKPTVVLAGVLLAALLFNPVHARASTPPNLSSLALGWTGSPSPGIAGYILNYGVASGQYLNSINVGNVTTNAVQGLVSGTTYFFSVSCYDTNGVESVLSNEISVAAPPPAAASVTATSQGVLTLSGPAGQSFNILAAENLSDWVVIGAVTLGASGSVLFTDTNAANFPKRFYCVQPKS